MKAAVCITVLLLGWGNLPQANAQHCIFEFAAGQYLQEAEQAAAKAAYADGSIEKKVCPHTGQAKYVKKSVCPNSGKTVTNEVEYCSRSGKFVNVSPSSLERQCARTRQSVERPFPYLNAAQRAAYGAVKAKQSVTIARFARQR
jgi:hypothetical protein